MRESGPIDYFETLNEKDKARFRSAVEEARSLLGNVRAGELTYLSRSSGGMLRLGKIEESGEVYITGATRRDDEDLQQMQNFIAHELGIKIL